MGNNSSSGNRNGINIVRRNCGDALNRSNLDERCKPSGLYKSCAWDDRTIRRLIGDGKVAARLVGSDERASCRDKECPICFLHYAEVNLLKCCKAMICTECYLQVQCPVTRGNPCPFCNKPKMTIMIANNLVDEEVIRKEEEEQRMIEAAIRAKLQGENGGLSLSSTPTSSFGSNLEQEMRARTRSMSSEVHDEMGIIAISPDDRRALEEEMMSQTSHPLLQQMAIDAEQERERHEMQHFERTLERMRTSRQHLDTLMRRLRLSRGSGSSPMAGFSDLESVELSSNFRERSNLEELMMLEAALYLTINGNGHTRGRGGIGHTLFHGMHGDENENPQMNRNSVQVQEVSSTDDNSSGRNSPDLNLSIANMLLHEISEQRQLELAIQLSLQEADERELRERQINDDESSNDVSEDFLVDHQQSNGSESLPDLEGVPEP